MKKRIYYFILLVFFLAGASLLVLKTKAQWDASSITPLVLGDDDEEDEEDEEDDEDSTSSSSSSPETVTIYVKLPDQIIKKLIEIVTFDSDGDGFFDPEDSTPNLHNLFLVKDDNLNGIVDAYENRE